MKRRFKLLMILIILFTSNAVYAQPIETIGVIGFVNRISVITLEGKEIKDFKIAEEYLMDGLIDGGKLDVIDLSAEAQKFRLDEAVLALEEGRNINELSKVDVDYLVYGYLNDMSVRISGGDIYTDIKVDAKNKTVCVNMTANVVDTVTGKTIMIVSGYGESGVSLVGVQNKDIEIKVGSSSVSEICVHNALEKAVDEIARKINNAA